MIATTSKAKRAIESVDAGKEFTSATASLLIVALGYGIAFASLGLGAGMIALSVSQGIGCGILCFGLGVFYALRFGAIAVIRIMAREYAEQLKKIRE